MVKKKRVKTKPLGVKVRSWESVQEMDERMNYLHDDSTKHYNLEEYNYDECLVIDSVECYEGGIENEEET